MSTHKLYSQVRSRKHLWRAWRHIRTNGLQSTSPETIHLVKTFDENALRNLERIAERLRHFNYSFSPQLGIAKRRVGKQPRPIVVAPIQDRIVHRSMLTTLVEDVPFVRAVLRTSTSIGGIAERGAGHALRLVNDAIGKGYVHFVKADIENFFGSIPRKMVIRHLSQEISDARFIKLLEDALATTLENERQLDEYRYLFPTGEEGVAQGSPLSPLFGNILMYEFDRKLNGRGIVCIRFIDDFIILGSTERNVGRAFESARNMLLHLGLRLQGSKTSCGRMDSGGVDFLGFHVERGLLQPSASARKRLIQKVSDRLREARRTIWKSIRDEKRLTGKNDLLYSQAISDIDKIIKGWGHSFAYGNSKSTITDLDRKISELVEEFNNWFWKLYNKANSRNKLRALGVQVLAEIPSKSLPDVPSVSSS